MIKCFSDVERAEEMRDGGLCGWGVLELHTERGDKHDGRYRLMKSWSGDTC